VTGRRYGRALLACALAAVWPAAPAGAAKRSAEAAFADSVVAEINTVRKQAGVRPLRRNGALASVARQHSAALGQAGLLDHRSPDGTPMVQRVKRAVRARRVAETLTWLPAGQTRAAIAVRVWMNSPSHRAALLSPAFARIGVGHWPGGLAGPGRVVTADLASAR
jgi:uncharacterized protein YkwD